MRGKKAIYNIITNIILQFITTIYGFVVPKVILDHFGSDVNGLVVSISQFLAYISLLESGFGPVVKAVLYKPIARKDNKTIMDILKTSEKLFHRISYVFIVYIIILCFLFPLIIRNDFAPWFTISLVIIIAISTFAEYYFGMVYRLFLQAKQKTYIVSIIQIISYIISIILIVLLANLGANVQIIKLTSGLIFVLRPLVQNYYVKKKYHINLKNADNNYKIKQKWDGLAQHIAAVIHEKTDVVVLTVFSTLSEVSVYSVYLLVAKGIRLLVLAFSNGIDASFGDMIAKSEQDNLRRKFSVYELLYMIVSTVAFSCAILLITPFVEVYTKGITDANYIRPVFGYLIVIAELLWAIKQPYSLLIKSAGHFKETRVGAWVEAVLNIVLSVVLVINYGMVGVIIGTIVSTFIRMVEFVYHANRYILKQKIWNSVGRIVVMLLAMMIVVAICSAIQYSELTGYMSWLLRAIIVFIISCIVTFIVNIIFYKNDVERIINRIVSLTKKILKRRAKKGVGK